MFARSGLVKWLPLQQAAPAGRPCALQMQACLPGLASTAQPSSKSYTFVHVLKLRRRVDVVISKKENLFLTKKPTSTQRLRGKKNMTGVVFLSWGA